MKERLTMATEKLQLYKCNVCGNLVQVILPGAGELICCGEPMELLVPHIEEENNDFTEKHTPKIETGEQGRFVRLKFHPMEQSHYIQFIEVYPKDKSAMHLKYLKPGDTAEFDITNFEEDVEAIELCNIHGLREGK